MEYLRRPVGGSRAAALSGGENVGASLLKRKDRFLWRGGVAALFGLALLALLAPAATAAEADLDARVQAALARLQERDEAARFGYALPIRGSCSQSLNKPRSSATWSPYDGFSIRLRLSSGSAAKS